MQSDILFDNIYIGHSVEDAAALRSETWDLKRPVEDHEESATTPKPDSKPSSPMDLSFWEDPIKYVKEKLDLFITIAKNDPVEAVRFLPEVAGGIGVIVVTMIAIIVGAVGMSTAAPSKEEIKAKAQKVKESVVDAKDKVVDATAGETQTGEAGANKRVTRSSGAAE